MSHEVLDVRFFRFHAETRRSMVVTSVITVGAVVPVEESFADLCETARRSLDSTTGEWTFVERLLMERDVPLREFVGRCGPIADRVREIMRRARAVPPEVEKGTT